MLKSKDHMNQNLIIAIGDITGKPNKVPEMARNSNMFGLTSWGRGVGVCLGATLNIPRLVMKNVSVNFKFP